MMTDPKTTEDQAENCKRMLILGSLLVIIGWIWGIFFPINIFNFRNMSDEDVDEIYTKGVGMLYLIKGRLKHLSYDLDKKTQIMLSLR